MSELKMDKCREATYFAFVSVCFAFTCIVKPFWFLASNSHCSHFRIGTTFFNKTATFSKDLVIDSRMGTIFSQLPSCVGVKFDLYHQVNMIK